MGIMQMEPWSVVLHNTPSERDIRRQLERLEREGQIEPIKLLEDGSPDLDSWVYAEAQVAAARRLRWPTILVC